MSDIYNRAKANFGGAFKADQAVVSFGSDSTNILVALTQQLSFQYSQAVTRLYELASNNIYYVGGRTQGQASLARVVGPTVSIDTIYSSYGDVCKASGNTINFIFDPTFCVSNNVASNTNRQGYTLYFCIITQVGVSVGAQDMVINDSTTLTFGELASAAAESDATFGTETATVS